MFIIKTLIYSCAAIIAVISVSFGRSAQAGHVEADIQICGSTASYLRYGESAPAIFGTSSNGIKERLFRIKGYLSIEKSITQPALSASCATADFVSLLKFRNIRLCVQGNLETIQRPDRVQHYILPKSFQTLDVPQDLILPSDLNATFIERQGSIPLSFELTEILEDNPTALVMNLDSFLRSKLRKTCSTIEATSPSPESIRLTLYRRNKTNLIGELVLQCEPGTDQDPIKIRFEFVKRPLGSTNKSQVSSTLRIDRPTESSSPYLFELLNNI